MMVLTKALNKAQRIKQYIENACDQIMTWDADFSRLLVTRQSFGGLMPPTMRHEDGYLWKDDTIFPCPDEPSFFQALGIAQEHIPEPSDRSAKIIPFLRSVQQF